MTRASENPSGRRLSSEPPLVVNGWTLYAYPAFSDRWQALREAVERKRETDPEGYRTSELARFFQALRRVVFQDIPRDPADERFQQGNTLGKGHRHWRRAKFLQRFRLFFRYHGKARIIVLVWLNDENSLRKAGSKTDPCRMFREMLERGRPPEDWDDLLASSEAWTQANVADESP